MRHLKSHGFTLVELAIVLMIIGLLIGGILKGQELITNARIASFIKQTRDYDGAVVTFQDSYGALPGDIANPSVRLPNCSAAKCNIAGDGNGIVGVVNVTASAGDENNNFWLHLGVANLISGMDLNSTWTSANYAAASFPSAPVGGQYMISNFSLAPNASFALDGRSGHYFINRLKTSSNTLSVVVPTTVIGRIDTKMDDGHPFRGDLKLCGDTYGVAYGATNYSTASSGTPGCFYTKTGF